MSPYVEIKEENVDTTQWKLKFRRYLPSFRKNYLFVGSVLSSTDSCSEVWGAGFLSARSRCLQKPGKIHAVRGKLSERSLVNQGISCPQVYGDPALILPEMYRPLQTRKYKFGIIPHYVDSGYRKGILGNLNACNMLEDMRIKIIDVSPNLFFDFINQVNECEYIASSSLHGLILAHAYGIPAVWVKFSDFISGNDGFKYLDYFSTTELNIEHPVFLDDWANVSKLLLKHSQCPSRMPSSSRLLGAYPL
ncbi:polysaccharide pyruvyl transferase family protein [Pseudomonadota bacterium]